MKTINGRTKKQLIKAIEELQQEIRQLTDEYNSGDPLEYSPDWFDSYVYPLQCDLWEAEEELELHNLIEKKC